MVLASLSKIKFPYVCVGFLFVCLFCFILFCLFCDRVSLYSSGCPGTHSVDQAGLELFFFFFLDLFIFIICKYTVAVF